MISPAPAGLVSELRRDFLLAGEPCRVIRADGPASEEPRAASIAIGAFDGVHRGHRHLLRKTVEDARARGIAAVAVTFDPDPDTVVSPHPAAKLMTSAARLGELARTGVDAVLVVPFTREVAALDHVAFFERVLAPYLDIASIHVGADFKLGAHGASNVEVISAWGAVRGISVTGHELVIDDPFGGEPSIISATHIRADLARGCVGDASRKLGRRYLVSGRVVHGRGEGTAMGFPTANVSRAELIQMPADGVYAGWTLVSSGDGASRVAYPAAINVGLPPMFAADPSSATLETTLLGFSGDLYGSEVSVLVSERLRPPVHFESREALVSTVKGNMEDVRRRFGGSGVDLSR